MTRSVLQFDILRLGILYENGKFSLSMTAILIAQIMETTRKQVWCHNHDGFMTLRECDCGLSRLGSQ